MCGIWKTRLNLQVAKEIKRQFDIHCQTEWRRLLILQLQTFSSCLLLHISDPLVTFARTVIYNITVLIFICARAHTHKTHLRVQCYCCGAALCTLFFTDIYLHRLTLLATKVTYIYQYFLQFLLTTVTFCVTFHLLCCKR